MYATGRRSITTGRYRNVHHMGHRFGPNLKCQAQDCDVDWEDHQTSQQPCKGQHIIVQRPANMKTRNRVSRLCQVNRLYQDEIAAHLEVAKTSVEYVFAGKARCKKPSTALKRLVVYGAIEMLKERGVNVAAEFKAMKGT